MNVRLAKFAMPLALVAVVALLNVASAQQKKAKWDAPPPKPKADQKMAVEAEAPSNEDAPASKGKVYRFKGEKKGAAGGMQMMILMVEDIFTGKAESLYVPNNDATSKEYDPLTEVASAVKEFAPGSAIEVKSEKVKGRTLVKSVAKADAKPGEELPNGFIFIDQKDMGKAGMPNIVVTLSKFGREVKATVPMFKGKEKDSEGKWEPDPKVDGQIRRLRSGTVVEAKVKPGKPPMLVEIYEYQMPERGKFVESGPVDFGSGKAMGIKIADRDEKDVQFTLDGVEQTKNGQTVYVPNPQQLAAVRKLKKGTPIEVRYRLDGTTWIVRDIRLLGPNESLTSGPKDDAATSNEPPKADDSMGKDDKKKDKAPETEKPNP